MTMSLLEWGGLGGCVRSRPGSKLAAIAKNEILFSPHAYRRHMSELRACALNLHRFSRPGHSSHR